jgi:hypothetical protein
MQFINLAQINSRKSISDENLQNSKYLKYKFKYLGLKKILFNT